MRFLSLAGVKGRTTLKSGRGQQVITLGARGATLFQRRELAGAGKRLSNLQRKGVARHLWTIPKSSARGGDLRQCALAPISSSEKKSLWELATRGCAIMPWGCSTVFREEDEEITSHDEVLEAGAPLPVQKRGLTDGHR